MREQERRDAELVDEEVRHADRRGAGRRQREGRVVERRRAVAVRPRRLRRAGLLAGGALELADELLGVDVAGAEGLVALVLTCARGTVRAPSRPGVRLGAPGFSLPSGVGVERGGRACRGRRDGRHGQRRASGSASAWRSAPLSMTCLIVPVMPGIVTWLTGVPGGTSTVAWMRSPVIRTTVTECSSARGRDRGNAKAGRSGDQRDDALPSFHVEYASPRAPRGASGARE